VAIGRLKMKVGGTGKAGPHASYIFREGRYARDETLERLDATESGNMPAWAENDPVAFWRAADAHERVNGTTYREMEIAIPRELSIEDRTALVRAFVAQEIGNAHAYQWAIHTPVRSSDGGEQPHVHLMFSERRVDGIERGPDEYFKRANSKAPERGGAKKGYGPRAGERLSREERAEHLKELRGRWEGMANDHLARAGRGERIDMRSYQARGLDVEPASRLLPSEWRDDETRTNVIAFRRATAELVQAEVAIDKAIPDRDAEIIDLYQERTKRLEREASGRGLIAGAARVAREELGAQTPSPAPPAPVVPAKSSPEAIVQRWTAEHQRQLVAVQAKARRIMGHAEGMKRRHLGAVQDHQRERPMPPQGMFATFKQASYEVAWKTWEKAADGLRRRAAQLGQRVEKLRDYLQPVTQYTPHHPGDRLAAERVERAQPDLAKAHAEVMRQQRVEQIAQADRAAKAVHAERVAQFAKAEREQGERQAKALEKIKEQRERERGRDDRGRGR
jgi:hypothetical protein